MAAPINPKGAKSDKIWRDAIMRAVRRMDNDPVPLDGPPQQRLERLADALVAKGLDGDVPAIKEVGDRLDGKATQTIAGDEENPLFPASALRELLAAKLDRVADTEPAPKP